jgi:hypothetical protein
MRSAQSSPAGKARSEERYFQFLNERQQQPGYRDRKITVEYPVSLVKNLG